MLTIFNRIITRKIHFTLDTHVFDITPVSHTPHHQYIVGGQLDIGRTIAMQCPGQIDLNML